MRKDASLPADSGVAVMNVPKGSSFLAMRFWAALLSGLMSVSVASAATLPEQIVSIIKEVCAAPISPEAMLTAGEKMAAAENWKLLRSEPAPIPFMHNENGAKKSFVSVWEFGLVDASQATLAISIVRPELPEIKKYNFCAVQPTIDIDGDELARTVNRRLGSIVTREARDPFINQMRWFFTEEMAKGNCGKQLVLFLNQQSSLGVPKSLAVIDQDYPNKEKFDLSTRCPNQ
ncbi:MAG: hypothetical protein QOJ86_4066 [Bradyrhizobium sp.]|jgi:hypothetical protein|nr:hypothetical protein [Bradyrhizobium sp.]